MTGHTGNDIFYGTFGSETYYHRPGDGRDEIVESPDAYNETQCLPDSFVFGRGITPGKLSLIRREDYLMIEFKGTASDGIVVRDWFRSAGPLYKIETFVFGDQSTWTVADIESPVVCQGGCGGDTLLGSDDHADRIFGAAGRDYIDGKAGNDLEIGNEF